MLAPSLLLVSIAKATPSLMEGSRRNRVMKGFTMTQAFLSNSNSSRPMQAHTALTSFDSGYEHSLGHYVDVKLLVLEEDEEKGSTPATFASAS